MNGLFTLEAAGRCGNFSKAAEELNVTPAAVSRMISRLEDHLDSPLFLRRPGGVDLTPAGQILFDAIARGFSGIEMRFGKSKTGGVGWKPSPCLYLQPLPRIG